jgi:hypothetical protein
MKIEVILLFFGQIRSQLYINFIFFVQQIRSASVLQAHQLPAKKKSKITLICKLKRSSTKLPKKKPKSNAKPTKKLVKKLKKTRKNRPRKKRRKEVVKDEAATLLLLSMYLQIKFVGHRGIRSNNSCKRVIPQRYR